MDLDCTNENLMGDNSEHNDRVDATDVASDRRRPGRRAYTDRLLIALLRGTPLSRPVENTKDAQENADAPMKAPGGSDNDLAPAVGILVSVGLSLLLWAIILLIVWPFIHGDGWLDLTRTRFFGKVPVYTNADKTLVWGAVAPMVPPTRFSEWRVVGSDA